MEVSKTYNIWLNCKSFNLQSKFYSAKVVCPCAVYMYKIMISSLCSKNPITLFLAKWLFGYAGIPAISAPTLKLLPLGQLEAP